MNLITYEAFGKLRFREYFPTNECYQRVENGFEIGIGPGGIEGYQDTFFGYSEDQPDLTAEIHLDFRDSPVEAGNNLLGTIGLKIRKGMTEQEVVCILGDPLTIKGPFFRFLLGQKWVYYVNCFFDNSGALCRVWVGRQDMVDKDLD